MSFALIPLELRIADFAQAERDPEEEGEFLAFEQLMAEATAKREKKSDAKKEEKKHRSMFGHTSGGSSEEKTEKMGPS